VLGQLQLGHQVLGQAQLGHQVLEQAQLRHQVLEQLQLRHQVLQLRRVLVVPVKCIGIDLLVIGWRPVGRRFVFVSF